MNRAWAYAALVALGITALVGCGGGDSGQGASDEEIKTVLNTFFTSAVPSQCDLITQKALQQIAPSVARADDPAARAVRR
jgi:hypothetical protein